MYSYYYLGQNDKALTILNRLLETKENGYNYEAACLYSLMGEKGKALEYLKISLEGGYYRFAHMRRDSDLDSIRNLPEFEALLKEYEDKVNEDNGGKDGTAFHPNSSG